MSELNMDMSLLKQEPMDLEFTSSPPSQDFSQDIFDNVLATSEIEEVTAQEQKPAAIIKLEPSQLDQMTQQNSVGNQMTPQNTSSKLNLSIQVTNQMFQPVPLTMHSIQPNSVANQVIQPSSVNSSIIQLNPLAKQMDQTFLLTNQTAYPFPATNSESKLCLVTNESQLDSGTYLILKYEPGTFNSIQNSNDQSVLQEPIANECVKLETIANQSAQPETVLNAPLETVTNNFNHLKSVNKKMLKNKKSKKQTTKVVNKKTGTASIDIPKKGKVSHRKKISSPLANKEIQTRSIGGAYMASRLHGNTSKKLTDKRRTRSRVDNLKTIEESKSRKTAEKKTRICLKAGGVKVKDTSKKTTKGRFVKSFEASSSHLRGNRSKRLADKITHSKADNLKTIEASRKMTERKTRTGSKAGAVKIQDLKSGFQRGDKINQLYDKTTHSNEDMDCESEGELYEPSDSDSDEQFANRTAKGGSQIKHRTTRSMGQLKNDIQLLCQSLKSGEESTEESDPIFGKFKYHCDVCTMPFKNQTFLAAHSEKQACRRCLVCGKLCTSHEVLKEHRQSNCSQKSSRNCYICEEDFSNDAEFQTHIKIHGQNLDTNVSVNNETNCGTCEILFSSNVELQEHANNYSHFDGRPFQCSECDKRFIFDDDLQIHKKVHTRHQSSRGKDRNLQTMKVKKGRKLNKKESFVGMSICQFCGKLFNSKRRCEIHTRIHTGEKPYSCVVCAKVFTHKSALTRHCFTHSKSVDHVCYVCGKGFPHHSQLNRHKLTHSEAQTSNKKQCPVCLKFIHPNYYNTHQLIHKERLRQFGCSICDMSFKSQKILNQHAKRHENNKNFICEDCGKTFHEKTQLEKHFWIHKDTRPYNCDVCNKGFVREIELRRHKSKYIEGSPGDGHIKKIKKEPIFEKVYSKQELQKLNKNQCPICLKLVAMTYLSEHKKTHVTLSRDFKCLTCNKTFTKSKLLRRHEKTHSGVKPHTCPIPLCNRRFQESSDLNRHIKTPHRFLNQAVKMNATESSPSKYEEMPGKEKRMMTAKGSKAQGDDDQLISGDGQTVSDDGQYASDDGQYASVDGQYASFYDQYASVENQSAMNENQSTNNDDHSDSDDDQSNEQVCVNTNLAKDQKENASEEAKTSDNEGQSGIHVEHTPDNETTSDNKRTPDIENIPDSEQRSDKEESPNNEEMYDTTNVPMVKTIPTSEHLITIPSADQKQSNVVNQFNNPDIYPFKCDVCNQRFPTSEHLLVHIMDHVPLSPRSIVM